MAISRDKKTEILKKIKEVALKAKSLVFVNFHGLPVALATKLRRALREQGISYLVAKKTLIGLAARDSGIAGELPKLEGEIALAYLSTDEAGDEDLIAPAREVYNFQQKNAELVKIVGGVFEGRYLDQAEMMTIAVIPPRETLCGLLANVINSPIQGLVIALQQIVGMKSA